jgi:hypothetical protein
MPLPVIPILTTAGRFALPYLQRELVKQGTKKFIKDHGKEALTAVTGGVILNRVMDEEQDPSITQSVAESPEGLVIGGEPKETLPPPPPLVTPEAEKIDTKLETPIDQGIKSEPFITPKPDIVDTTLTTPVADTPKKEDFILTKDKAETGALTDVEVQTAKSLKGEQPDYYSKVIKGMDDFKQPIASKEQLKNYIKNLKATEAETIYLGIDNLIDSYKGDTVDISKFKKALAKRDIATTIRVEEVPKNYPIRGTVENPEGSTHYKEFAAFHTDPENIDNHSYLLIKFDRPPGEESFMGKATHINPNIGKDTIAHVRGQMGFVNPKTDIEALPKEEKQAAIKLKNTFIVDEIQSDYLQAQRENGFVGDYKILNSDEIIDFLNKNNVKYIRDNREDTNVIIFDQKGRIDFRDIFRVDPDGAVKTREIPLGDKYRHIVFKNNFLHSLVPYDAFDTYQNKYANSVDLKTQADRRGKTKLSKQTLDEKAKMYLKQVYKPVPNLPIVKTEKWVDLSIDAAIKKAIDEGADSIAFPNGNVQVRRYLNMGGDAEKQEGMRYFYDNIVYKKFDKIAKKYGVEIEEIDLRETMFKELTKQYTYAENNANAVLTKMTAIELLNNLTKQDVELPDYFKMFIAVPRFDDPKVLRTEMINQKSIVELLQTQANIIKSYEDPQPMSETQELLRDSVEKKVGSYGAESEYLVWVYNKGTENEEVYLNLPAIQVKLSNYAKTGAEGFADEGLRDLSTRGVVTNFETSKYINDYDAVLLNEEIDDTVRTETYYKLPLPKELQKEILSKPKKMSKLQGQSNRLFA